MDSSGNWLARVADALGPTSAPRPLGGGAWRLEAGGRPVLAKVGAGVADEAAGLRLLSSVSGAPATPRVLVAEGGLMVTEWLEQVPRTPDHEERLGRELAVLHRARAASWGGGSAWIGACPVDTAEGDDGPAFYRARLTGLARRCGLEPVVGPVAERLGELAPFGEPSLLHGDLWWGNVLWGPGGRPWLIDPSVHGGHPEEDLAMLALFGEAPARLLAAYADVRRPEDGWQDRVPLFQLVPLLVHAVLFGGGYRTRAAEVARRFTGG